MNLFQTRVKNLISNPKIFVPPIIDLLYKKYFSKKKFNGWIEENVNYNFIFNLFANKTVLNGPFKGMLYPELNSTGSALFPKLLGSYEKELHFEIEKLLKTSFTKIIDIGCAEGYYAVGFARVINDAEIQVFDINPNAIEMCKKMANLNNLKNIFYNSACTIDWILNNDLSNSLIISDCEGFELNLFTDKDSVASLSKTSLLIETHDFIDLYTSDKIKECFSNTHEIKSIFSVDDINKIKLYNYPELINVDVKTKYSILKEGRPYSMEWLVLTPKF